MKRFLLLAVVLFGIITSGYAKTLFVRSIVGEFTLAINGIVQVENVTECKITGITGSPIEVYILINGTQIDRKVYYSGGKEVRYYRLKREDRGDEYRLSSTYELAGEKDIAETPLKLEGKEMTAMKEEPEEEKKEREEFVSRPVDVVFFCADNLTADRPYWLLIDDVVQNLEPVEHLKVSGLPSGKHKVELVFKARYMDNLTPYYYGRKMDTTFIGATDYDGYIISNNTIPDNDHPYYLEEDGSFGEEEWNVWNKVKSQVVEVPYQAQNTLLAKIDNQRVTRAALGEEEGKCKTGMSSTKLNALKERVHEARSEKSLQARLAQKLVEEHCFTTAQLAELLNVFDSDAYRWKVAEFAYDFVVDPQNFPTIKTAFEDEKVYKRMAITLGL